MESGLRASSPQACSTPTSDKFTFEWSGLASSPSDNYVARAYESDDEVTCDSQARSRRHSDRAEEENELLEYEYHKNKDNGDWLLAKMIIAEQLTGIKNTLSTTPATAPAATLSTTPATTQSTTPATTQSTTPAITPATQTTPITLTTPSTTIGQRQVYYFDYLDKQLTENYDSFENIKYLYYKSSVDKILYVFDKLIAKYMVENFKINEYKPNGIIFASDNSWDFQITVITSKGVYCANRYITDTIIGMY